MKKCLAFILALSCLCSCSLLSDDPVFKFDSDGVPYSAGAGISMDTFVNSVAGHGWRLTSEKRIKDSGIVASKNSWETSSGHYIPCYEINLNSINVYSTVEFSESQRYGYDSMFDNSKIFIKSGDPGSWATKFNVLSVKDDTMIVIHFAGGGKYYYSTFKRMTDKELDAVKESHHITIAS